jgi:hypothetical protein
VRSALATLPRTIKGSRNQLGAEETGNG